MRDRTKRSAELEITEFQSLTEMNLIEQIDWVQENIDADAVGIDGLSAEFSLGEEPEMRIIYWVDPPKPVRALR